MNKVLVDGRLVYELHEIPNGGRQNRWSASVQRSGPLGSSDDECKEIAANIALALNSHDALIKALERYNKLMDSWAETGVPPINPLLRNRAKARAALKLARGEQ